MKRQAGITLLEVMLAVMLLSVLSVAMMLAMRLGISALAKTDQRLMDNRRVAGAQRILEQQIEGLIPAMAACSGGVQAGEGPKVSVFSGQPDSLTLVSAYSIQGAWRGRPQILQFFVAPGDQGGGLRLLVNEIPYLGPKYGGQICTNPKPDGQTAGLVGQFAPPQASTATFVLADRLRSVSFQYLKRPEQIHEAGAWLPMWNRADWPAGIRVLIEPMEPNPARLQPVTVTAPVFIYRTLGVQYSDQ